MKFGASVLNVEMCGTVGGMGCIAQIVVLNLNPNSIMKTENTPENKARFFALYYGQKIAKAYEKDSLSKIGGIYDIQHMIATDWHLSLRSISSLTDEEYKHVARLSYRCEENHTVEIGKQITKGVIMDNVSFMNPRLWLAVTDYLRSIGILIPWMDLSVEDIKDYGWAKEVVHA